MIWPALPARVDIPMIATERGRRNLATACGPRASCGPLMLDVLCRVLVGLPHQEVLAVGQRMPVWLDLHADFQLLGRAVDHVGDDVDADVERDAGDGIGLGALEGRRPAVRDGEGEHRALARHLAPFDVAPPAGEDAHRAREVLIFLRRLAVLDHELLLPRRLPERHAEIVVLDVALDAERIVQCDSHDALYWFGTSASAALEPQLRP